jgi:hypothetical protein
VWKELWSVAARFRLNEHLRPGFAVEGFIPAAFEMLFDLVAFDRVDETDAVVLQILIDAFVELCQRFRQAFRLFKLADFDGFADQLHPLGFVESVGVVDSLDDLLIDFSVD